ncbi:MAG: aminoacetone oxidase family FAD-binding enzyme, partial [Betaproteobacteria bacterium]|nr:aminoacetone oxidase family FAD-binding enzyme [Betaproteobacteria bacterium]
PLQPSNCGFDVRVGDRLGWSPHLRQRFAGQVLKNVGLSFEFDGAVLFDRVGEMVITDTGIEGSLIYAASSHVRKALAHHGSATLHLNLRPDFTPERLHQEVAHPRGSRTLSSHLHSRVGLTKLHTALLHEVLAKETLSNPATLAQAMGHLPITLHAPRPIAEAISSAGGVDFTGLSPTLMVQDLPGVFCAGEMLDWEAPTGGYLLTACWASGRVAGLGVLGFLNR